MNVVYIFCDELRQDALECYGNPYGEMFTPNIDSIADRGVLFENCYCNSPVCVPSRTSLLTGLYPEDTGVYHNEAAHPFFKLEGNYITFPEVLRENGFATANFGKTHLPRPMRPFDVDNQEGADMRIGGGQEKKAPITRILPGGSPGLDIGSIYPENEKYTPEKVTENALEWMSEQKGQYFVRISYLQPHTPVMVKAGYEDVYKGYPFNNEKPCLDGLSDFEKGFSHVFEMTDFSPAEIQTAKEYYYGMVHWIDDEVGKIINFLKKNNQLENTIIIFNADHGAVRGECGAMVGKHIFNRASQAVPLIISVPGKDHGRRERRNVSNIDIAKTLFNLLHIDIPAQFKGNDLFSNDYPEYVFSTIGYGNKTTYALPAMMVGKMPDGSGWPRRSCVRKGNYRLDMSVRQCGENVAEGHEDLFFTDTEKYPDENVNLAADPTYDQIVKELKTVLMRHVQNATEPDMSSIPVNFVASKMKLMRQAQEANK